MTKFRWTDSTKMFRNHIDPEKEEQLKWITLEMDNKVKKILKLVKSINNGNKEANLKKRSELIQHIEDFHKQYQSLYALYDDLKEGVKKRCNTEEDDKENDDDRCSASSSSASIESISYYSPGSESKTPSHCSLKTTADWRSVASSVEDASEVVKEALSVEPVLGSHKSDEPEEDSGGRIVEKLVKEIEFLRERLDEGKKRYKDLEKESCSKINELEEEVIVLKLEIEASTSRFGKGELKGSKSEAVSEVDRTFNEKDDVLKKIEEGQRVFEVDRTFNEKDDVLKKIEESERVIEGKLDESMDKVRSLQKVVESLQSRNELEKLRTQKTEAEMEVQKKTKEVSDGLVLVESLKAELKQKTTDEESLKRQVNIFKTAIQTINDETRLSKSKIEKQGSRISQLEGKLKEKNEQILSLETKLDEIERDMTKETTLLAQQCRSLETDKRELELKNSVLAAALEERDILVNKWKINAKSVVRRTERKMEETVVELRKKSEDSVRLLTRRIRVAEQLHNENKDWYKKLKEQYEEKQKDIEKAVRIIKLLAVNASDTSGYVETRGLRFVECCEHFMSRISRAYCAVNFAKEWVRRKNEAIAQVKEDCDNLLIQLDDKEEEILRARQKVLKLEGKVRELKRTVKEREEGMIGLKEEKREAIRQLCVWIDYHRGRSDFLKKVFFDVLSRKQKPG